MNQETNRLRLQIKFNWKVALCVLFLFAVLIRLGFWQLERAQQKRRIQSDRSSRSHTLPIAIEKLIVEDKNALQYRKVTLDGRYDNNKSILFTNQVFQGKLGFEVITIFELQASDHIVLVSRGWIAAEHDSNKPPSIKPVTGTVQLVGEIHILPSKSFFLPQKFNQAPNWPLRLHHIDISGINQYFNRPVLPLMVRLDPNNPGVLKRHWPIKRIKPGNSTSYAVQWFGMALLLVLLSIIKSTNILEIIQSRNQSNK